MTDLSLPTDRSRRVADAALRRPLRRFGGILLPQELTDLRNPDLLRLLESRATLRARGRDGRLTNITPFDVVRRAADANLGAAYDRLTGYNTTGGVAEILYGPQIIQPLTAAERRLLRGLPNFAPREIGLMGLFTGNEAADERMLYQTLYT